MKDYSPQIYSDAGRSTTPGFEHERNDCTVRSIAHAFQIPYIEAHGAVKQTFGRRDCDGVLLPLHNCYCHYFLQKTLNKIFIVKHYDINIKRNLKHYMYRFEKGVYIVELTDHVFTIIDGVVLDNRFNDRCFPIGYFELEFLK